jgi:hypothetical protein
MSADTRIGLAVVSAAWTKGSDTMLVSIPAAGARAQAPGTPPASLAGGPRLPAAAMDQADLDHLSASFG